MLLSHLFYTTNDVIKKVALEPTSWFESNLYIFVTKLLVCAVLLNVLLFFAILHSNPYRFK